MSVWNTDAAPRPVAIGPAGWTRAVARGLALGLVTFGGLALLLLGRLIERPIFGPRRPATPHITQFVCRAAFVILGIERRVHGRPIRRGGAIVANHSSWLDIFALNAGQRVYFVSKDEVRKWPGIGWLARATGTVFIRRDRREARAHRDLLAERVSYGHKLLFFPEGTSTDGLRVLPFKTTLFDAFVGPGSDPEMVIQPVALAYTAPPGQDPRFYGWWGEMSFGPHLLKVLSVRRQGRIDLHYGVPVRIGDHPHRKALAARCHDEVARHLPARDAG